MAGVLLDEGLRDRERLAKVEGRLEESHRHVATREDVQAVRTDLVGVQATLQSEIAGVRSELKAEISGVRSDMRLLTYVLSIVLVLLLALFGDITLSDVLRLLLRLGGG